jgi:hypothetical protein
MARREITCVNHENSSNKTHGGIKSVGGAWTTTSIARKQVVDDIDGGVHSYFVKGDDGSEAKVVTKGTAPNKYISSTPDDSKKDNLLAKPTCR